MPAKNDWSARHTPASITMSSTPDTVLDISGFLVSLRTKEDWEVAGVAKSVCAGKAFTEADWKKAKSYAKWIMDVRDRALLSNFFNEMYQGEHWWLTPPLEADTVMEAYRKWMALNFTELERACIKNTEDDLLEYLLMFSPERSVKNKIYYGFKERTDD